MLGMRHRRLAVDFPKVLAAFFGIGFALGCTHAPSPLSPQNQGSIGSPSQGVLTDAEPLPDRGRGFRRYRRDDTRWGTPELVGAIVRAAAEVATRFPDGAPLIVGDLSQLGGGQIERHRSHRTGRDADLLFYATTPSGRPVPSPGFLNFGADGLAVDASGNYYALDVPRTWSLVRALVTQPRLRIQWLFVAKPIEALLIDFAFARGEDLRTIWQAETVMQQPSDGLAHADHIHIRLGCPMAPHGAACIEKGPSWPWWEQASDRELLTALLSPPGKVEWP